MCSVLRVSNQLVPFMLHAGDLTVMIYAKPDHIPAHSRSSTSPSMTYTGRSAS
jgi:hypothetical protein